MKKILVVVLSALMLTLSLTSCKKEVVSQGVTKTEVLIGNCAATSGNLANVGGPFVAGLEAYLKYVNDAGGVAGRKIKFVHKDDGFVAEAGLACTQEMINDNKVFALVGHFGTPTVGATMNLLKETGVPAVYFATGIGQLYDEKATEEEGNYNLFPVQPIYKTEGRIMVARAVGDFNAKKIGIIYTNDDAGKDLLAGAKTQVAALTGVTLIEQQVAYGSTDVSAAVTAIKNAEVDFIIAASNQVTIATIIKELAAQSVNKDVITTYVNVAPAYASLFINEIQGKFDVYGNGWVAFDAAHKAALDLYVANIDAQYAANAYAITGWIAAYYFVEGLKRVDKKTLNWDNFRVAMESAPIVNPFGGVIDFKNGQRLGTMEMNLSKASLGALNAETNLYAGIWTNVKDLESIESILK